MKYKGFTYTPAPKTAWDNLSMQEKSEMMKVAVKNGITDLKTIREKYNEFAEGGYLDWKEKASKYKHLDIDNDRTYDYEGWYNENPQRAWDFLNDSPNAHFDDKYKTVYHPTFSTQSRYSGIVDPTYNPQGLIGGTWNKQGTVFTMSPDGYRGPVSMDERKWYLENAEDNGVQLREADGSLPVFDGIPWGGVLPGVTITGNKFTKGGNLYAGTSTDNDLVDWIIKEEGFTAKPTNIGDGKRTLGSGLTSQKWHDLYKKRGNKWSETDNRSAVAQEVADRRRWAEKNIPNWDTLPESSQKALLAYKYNYDFNAANSPKLFKALRDSNLHEAARQMNATSRDPKFQKGLMNRRKREQAWFLSDVGMPDIAPPSAPIIAQPVSTSVYNPYPVKIQNTTVAPRMVPDKDSYVKAPQLTELEIRQQKLQERWDAINRFNTLMDMLNIQNNPLKQFTSNNPIFSGIEGLIHADGGKIHIKPENRGKFTALKERTGHSATWFKEHGTPAQKKMAVFALNSRHWKHGLGGDLNTYNYGNTFGDGGLFGNETVDTVASFLPIVGTAQDAYQFYQDPSWSNAGWLALSLGSDIFTGGMASRAIKTMRAANKAVNAANDVARAARKEFRAAKTANGANHTKESGTRVRHAINAAGSAGDTRNAAIRRANDALFETGIKVGIDQGVNGFLNAAQMDMLPTFGLQQNQKHGLGGNLFEDGGDENPMNYEHRGTIFDDDLKNQGITHIAELPEVVVKGRDYTKPYKSAFEYDPNFAKELPYFLPVVGDALDVADIAKDVYNRDYLNAGIGAGLFVLPNFIEKPIKKIGRKAFQLFTAPTRKAAEKGRSTLLEAIPSSWNRERWSIAAPNADTDAIINDLEQRARTVPFKYSKTSDELEGKGLTVARPALVYYKDGKKVKDYYNSGLDVYIASDLGKRAYTTGTHETIHYITGNSNGIPKVGIPKFGSLFEPIEVDFNATNETTIPPSTLYQDFMVDYNDNLLPKINKESRAFKINDEYNLNKNENQTWLKTWFLSDVKPHLKNPNNANEIEKFLNEHPEVIKNNWYVNTLMKDTRPGTNKDYSKALSRMLYSTLVTAGLLNTVKDE